MEVFLYRVIKLTVSGNVSECRDPVRGEKRPTFLQMHAKMCHFYCTRDTKREYREHGKVFVHTAVEFFGCNLFGNRAKAAK